MPAFQFSLDGLLQLRRRELRQLELRAAAESQRAEAARQQHRRLWRQLDEQTPAAAGGGKWIVFHQAAAAVRRQAEDALRLAGSHEQSRLRWESLRKEKQSEVDALELLRDRQQQEHRRRQQRREQHQQDDHSLRQWQDRLAGSRTENDI